jgi:hypothetical protein
MRKKNGHQFTSETGKAAAKDRKPRGKNKLTRESWLMIDRLFKDWARYGPKMLQIMRAENPGAYARLVFDLAGKLALDGREEQEVPKILVIRWLDEGDEEPPVPMVKGDDNVVQMKLIDAKPIPPPTDPAA